jgi:hypothetical protein
MSVELRYILYNAGIAVIKKFKVVGHFMTMHNDYTSKYPNNNNNNKYKYIDTKPGNLKSYFLIV